MKKIFFGLVLLSIASTLSAMRQDFTPEQTIQYLKEENNQLRWQISSLEKQLQMPVVAREQELQKERQEKQQLQMQVRNLQAQLEDCKEQKQRLDYIAKDFNDCVSRLNSLRQENIRLNQENQELRKKNKN